MKHLRRSTWMLAALCLLFLAACGTSASASGAGVPIPFTIFLESVKHAQYTNYRMLPTTKVKNQKAFEEMRSYILTRYQGQVTSSYMASGMTFDCVQDVQYVHPQEPSDVPGPSPIGSEGNAKVVKTPLCPGGGAPLQRVMLEDLVQFHTLQDYLQVIKKSPGDIPPAAH
jgi:hypothetical protein